MSPQPLPESPWVFAPERWPEEECVAAGADLEPATLIAAYRAGAFPMPLGGLDAMAWWSPTVRGVLGLDDLHVSRSLRRSIARYDITVDTSFGDVVSACADPSRAGAWIDPPIAAAYVRLHDLGWAHSIEVRECGGSLVGGLYGVAIGGLFAGESMFHHARDASKVALVALVDVLRDDNGGARLIDVQWQTPHLATLGVTTMARRDYLAALPGLLEVPLPSRWA